PRRGPRGPVPSPSRQRAPLAQAGPASEHVVGAVAVGSVVGSLAAAKVDRTAAGGNKAQRLQAGLFVGAIAERLFLRAPAGTPPVRPAFPKFHLIGPLLGAERLVGHPPLDQADWRCWHGDGFRQRVRAVLM